MSPWTSGYVAAARWFWPRWCNPWPEMMFPTEREHWNAGFDDALADRYAPRMTPRLQAEFEASGRGS